ncbi:MAG: Crp/Fnr family transcriptional regulator [Saprospirales bacterium]|jgi:CRP/FNR family cyclic AMP-dependent transcriptional regulator|nr:Crp/Fnr family transcriptional regulator [Saprospirales bacterium]
MDTKTTIPVFDSNPLFAVLTAEELLLLQQTALLQSYAKHQVLYKPGQAANKVFFLLKGTVKVAVHAEKKDIIKYVVRPGSLFGESCLTGENQRRDFAYAMEEVAEVIEFDAQTLLAIMRKNFAFAQSLLHFLGERLRYTESQLENVVLKDSKSRILEFLHQMGLEHGKRIGFETLVKHNMTHQDIADLTGTSRQMVTAVLNHLKRSNVLYFNRKKILFRDLNALPMAS